MVAEASHLSVSATQYLTLGNGIWPSTKSCGFSFGGRDCSFRGTVSIGGGRGLYAQG